MGVKKGMRMADTWKERVKLFGETRTEQTWTVPIGAFGKRPEPGISGRKKRLGLLRQALYVRTGRSSELKGRILETEHPCALRKRKKRMLEHKGCDSVIFRVLDVFCRHLAVGRAP